MKLRFWGAAGTVTGSMHELAVNGRRYLLDCGLHQGRRKESDAVNRNLPVPGPAVDGVILSHAHIDHSGNLPGLVKNGFSGPIYTTPATVDLCDAMLRDTAHIQEKDAEFLNKRAERQRRDIEPVIPLYTMADAERTLPLFEPVPYYAAKELGDGLSYQCYDAGHMLGSSSVLVNYRANGSQTRLLYSGDIGRPGPAHHPRPRPIARRPTTSSWRAPTAGGSTSTPAT